MIGRFGSRARSFFSFGGHPRTPGWGPSGRARIAALTVVTLAAAGGAAALRPDAMPRRQVWHDRVAEAPGAGGGTSAAAATAADAAAGSDASAPATASATGSAAAGTAGPGAAPAAAAQTAAPPVAAGGATSTITAPGGRAAAPAAGKSTATTAPAGAGAAAKPVKVAPQTAGWLLLPKAPIGGRVGHTAVWTGREMVIWGGTSDLDSDPRTDGAAFDPAARTWRKLSPAPLSPRFDATARWTGREMVVFGGTSVDGDILADGAAWDPASNGWRPIPASPLGARDGAVVAWAGDRLVVWGGAAVPPPAAAPAPGDTPALPSPEMRDDGSAYVPATDSWVPVAAAPIPARSGAESVWTGTRLVISGGYHEGDSDDRTDGAALDPVTGVWSPIAARPAPASCGGDTPCDGVWTGAAALFPAPLLAYDPAGDRWSAVPAFPSADAPLAGAPTVWSGRELLAWGTAGAAPVDGSADSAGASGAADGSTVAAPPPPPTGGLYDPATNRWQTLPAGPLSGRVSHTAVWTGQEMLVWGGTAGDTGLADGAAFQPPG